MKIFLDEMMTMVGQTNSSKGWHDRLYTLMEAGDAVGTAEHVVSKLALVTTEVAEAIEEVRILEGFEYDRVYYSEEGKPEGVAVEIADTVIRLLDLCYQLDIPLVDVMLEKLAYNDTRPHKHGGKAL